MSVRVTRTAQASWQGDLTEGGGRIELRTEGEVPGVDSETFERLAQQAKETCPVSRALAGTDITLEVRLGGS